MKPIYPALAFGAIFLGAVFWASQSSEAPVEEQAVEQASASTDSVSTGGAVNSEQVRSEEQRSPAAEKRGDPDAAQSAVTDADLLQEPQLAELNPDYPTMAMRLHEMTARRDGQAFDPTKVRDALAAASAWEPSDDAGAGLDLTEEERNDGREFIEFSRMKLESLVAGDTLELPVSQSGQNYQAEITQAVANNDGTVTWHGKLVDELGAVTDESGSVYDVTFTSGQRMASGGMFTPEGHFVIEAVGEQGWIANASTLFKFDENEPDFIIPDEL
ncbi:hypothetical protein [Pseudomonas sp. OIL-1]|uniref:hypothetical protein n=1 Tax=Pseudomonas sp. OIL-1 TaxID=2706126 RepID=UPI0013A70FBF|nr:hypothetical protein [Pseudomonas sp. OIL-1]QIB49812.1 hypothetical protein G3M63_01295 [Pseudomonas sp. OIL-1]